jgi:hypothetical protein
MNSRRWMLRYSGAAMLAPWAAPSFGAVAVAQVAPPKDEAVSDGLTGGSVGAGRTQFLTTTDGRRLCFAQWGRYDGFPVVTLHGSPGSRFISSRAEALMQELGIRLITYDRPGTDTRPAAALRRESLTTPATCGRSSTF